MDLAPHQFAFHAVQQGKNQRLSRRETASSSSRRQQGASVTEAPGLTLVLGANGLGKTTLVTMLFRLLTGPSDITALVVLTLKPTHTM